MVTRTQLAEFQRFRRLRRTEGLRSLVRETRLAPEDFVYPLFVAHGSGVREEIKSMPGQYHLSVDRLAEEARELKSLGVPAVMLFGLPAAKDEVGSEGYASDGIVQQAVRELKDASPELVVITDVCLCEYTSHGHCGVVTAAGEVDNDATLPLLARAALSHVEAGADMVAPSDMMDGRVITIREALDDAGYESTPIMAYAAKQASAFYGPFREAAGSAPPVCASRSNASQSLPPSAWIPGAWIMCSSTIPGASFSPPTPTATPARSPGCSASPTPARRSNASTRPPA